LALAVGGLIITWLGWQGVFFAMVPLGVFGALLAFLFLQEQKGGEGMWRFDWVGAVILFCGLTLLMFVLTQLRIQGWRSARIQLAGAGVLLCAGGFYWHERDATNSVVDWQLVARPGFGRAILGSFCSQASRSAALFLTPFQFERVLGLRPAQVGVLLVALPVAELLLAPLSGWWADRSGSRNPTALGMLLVSLCFLVLAYLPSDSRFASVAGTIALLGVGLGLFHSANNSLAMGAASADQLSMAASTLATVITLGVAIGVAFASTVLEARLDHYLTTGLSRSMALGNAARDVYLSTVVVTLTAVISSWLPPTEEDDASLLRLTDS
jgi:predicted MFS family arabinose efflux permease